MEITNANFGPFYVEINGVQATSWIWHLPYALTIVEYRYQHGSQEDIKIINVPTGTNCNSLGNKFNKKE